MKNKKKPLAQMFNLLSREKKLLVSEISEERDVRKRSELSQDLEKVRGILLEIKTAQ